MAKAPSFKKIQQQYPDAIRFTATLTDPSKPIGEEGMARIIGGGKVLYYAQSGRRETIIVSKIADLNVTIIYGPPGSGKTSRARGLVENNYERNEIWLGTIEDLIEVNFKMLPVIKVVIIDQFLPCRRNAEELILKSIVNMVTGKPAEVKKIVCVQWLGGHQLRPFHNYPFNFIQMPA